MGRVSVAVVVTKLTAGAGGVALRGAMSLDPNRFAVTIMAGEGNGLFARANAEGLKVITLRHLHPDVNPREDMKGVRELKDLLTMARFDVVHTHSAKAGAIGRIAARRALVRGIVHTFHGFPFHDFQSRLRRNVYINTERRLAHITNQFLAIGPAVAAQAVRLGIAPADRIRVCDSSVDGNVLPVTKERRTAARAGLGIPQAMKVVGTVGRLDYQKAPLHLIEAIAQTRRADIFGVWIGSGPLLQKAKRLVVERGLKGRFLLLGERNDVANLLPAFDVFAMSSLYEGIPCALVEAMQCGIPAVATAVNGVPDIVIAGQTGLLARPGRPESLSRAIAYLLANPDHAAAMARSAQQLIQGRFGLDTLRRDLISAYEAALGESTFSTDTPLAAVGS